VQLVVDAFVQYKVVISELAAFKVESVINLIKYMTQGTLKTVFCEHTLGELLTNRKMIEKKLTEIIDPLTIGYGIHVIKIGTKQI
jgi:regulator of protease activity HflC (stomatin/prohibitin superfamily)